MDVIAAMEAFMKVAELESFTQAGRALQLPLATVSTRVTQLEDRLGLKLLTRTTRQVRLTDDGRGYYEWARRWLGEISEVEDQMRGRAKDPHGRIRVDVPASAGRHVIAPALPEFCELYPNITVDLGCTDRPVDLIAEGVDCVIRGGEIEDEQLVGRLLGRFHVITCAAPSYLERFGTPISPFALNDHRAVNFFSAKTGVVMPLDFEIDGKSVEVELNYQIGTNDADAYLSLVKSGVGIGQFPLSKLIQEEIQARRLIPILSEWQPERFPLYVVYPQNRYLTARVRAFVDWTIELYDRVFKEIETY